MCTEMRFALFTRYVIYNTAKYHLQQLRQLARSSDAKVSDQHDVPLYGDRTLEARGMPEATGFIGDSIERAFELIGGELARTDVTTKACMEANANAWGLACPSILKDGKRVRQQLLMLDEVARGIDIDENHIKDPVSYLAMFDLGPLEVCFKDVAGRPLKAVEISEKSAVPLDELRRRLIESVSSKQNNNSANAQSQPGAPLSYGKGRGALGRSDKGGKAAGPHHQSHRGPDSGSWR